MTVYINAKYPAGKETLDEFETRKEANKMLIEYSMCNPGVDIWVSQKCCKNWRDE